MSSAEGPKDELEMIMAEVLDGSRSIDDAKVREAFARSPELPLRLAELRALQRELDASGEAAQSSIARALGERADGGTAHWGRVVAEFAQRNQPRAPTPWYLRGFGILGIAAAAMVFVTAVWWSQRPAAEPSDSGKPRYFLDAGAKQLQMAPAEFYRPDDVWTWTQPIPAGGKAELRFFDADDPSTIDPIVQVTVREGFEWRANPKQQQQFVPHMRWELRMRDATGGIRVSGSVLVQRR